MEKEYINIKDNCRKGLLKYLEKAISTIPLTENSRILDAGCGSGVPTIFLAQEFNCKITAVDTDKTLIAVLKENVKMLELSNKINAFTSSLFDLKSNMQFDLILAEGILNAVGFQKGFLKMLELLKSNGFIIIHDEFLNQNEKIHFIEDNNCKILKSFVLAEQVWWDDYYMCLEKEITTYSNDFLKLFKSDKQEIASYKKDPSRFKSTYFVIKKLVEIINVTIL